MIDRMKLVMRNELAYIRTSRYFTDKEIELYQWAWNYLPPPTSRSFNWQPTN